MRESVSLSTRNINGVENDVIVSLSLSFSQLFLIVSGAQRVKSERLRIYRVCRRLSLQKTESQKSIARRLPTLAEGDKRLMHCCGIEKVYNARRNLRLLITTWQNSNN
jgi:hypothetical protein